MGLIRKNNKSYTGIGDRYWQPIGGGISPSTPYDAFGAFPAPSPGDLISAYEDVVYSVATQIAGDVSSTPLTLCVKTVKGQRRPKCQTKSLRLSTKRALPRSITRKAIDLSEVSDHFLLDLMEKPNPQQTGQDLIYLTELMLSVEGCAFWRIINDDLLGKPAELWLLPSHLVTVKRDQETGEVQSYKYDGEEFQPDEIIHFLDPNLADPYVSPYGPVRAVWQKIQVSRKSLSALDSGLTNLARPAAILSPPEGGFFGPATQARLSKQFQDRFRLGLAGGVWTVQDAVKYTPIQYGATDRFPLEVSEEVRRAVCRVFHFPASLLDPQDVPYSGATAAERSYQLHCLVPRVNEILSKLNTRLAPLFDDRMFFVADSIVAPDRNYELQKIQIAASLGVLEKNEVREALDWEPLREMEGELAGAQPNQPLQLLPSQDNGPKKFGGKKSKGVNDLEKQLASRLSAVFSAQRDSILSQAKSFAGSATKAMPSPWLEVDHWTEEMAKACNPVITAIYDDASTSLIQSIAGNMQVPWVVRGKLVEAANRATMEFAKSTNETTSLAIEEARKQTREQLIQGMNEGEVYNALAKRINDIFENATKERAYLIAETESTRASFASEMITAKESNLNLRKQWDADNLACPICSKLHGEVRGLDEPFAKIGNGPYAMVGHPPAHPACRCNMAYVEGD